MLCFVNPSLPRARARARGRSGPGPRHADTALDPGPLRVLLGSPRLHHWHHEIAHSGRVNFANLSPLLDVLFGTYHDPGHMPSRHGIPERIPHGWLRQMVQPLLPAPRAVQGTP